MQSEYSVDDIKKYFFVSMIQVPLIVSFLWLQFYT